VSLGFKDSTEMDLICDPMPKEPAGTLWDTIFLVPGNRPDLGLLEPNDDNEETYLEGVYDTGDEEFNKDESFLACL
jgi:hypothetical protein